MEVVAETEGEAEPVEPLGDEHRQVPSPEPLVAEPAEVLDVAAEQPCDAPHAIRRLLDERKRRSDRLERVRLELDPVGELEDRVHEAARRRRTP